MTDLQDLIPLNKLSKKMICIADDVKYIQKQGRNQFHKYNYVTENDVLSTFLKRCKSRVCLCFLYR